MTAPQRIPGVTYAAAPRAEGYASVLSWPPRLVVVHDTGNPSSTRASEASYAAGRTDAREHWTSAHAYIDEGGVTGSLRLDRQAWAAKAYGNRVGWHLELCLPGNRAATRARAAGIVRILCDLAGIPKVKLTPAQVEAGNRGVCGHRDFTLAGIDGNDHEDPGADFPWAEFMSLINSGNDLGVDVALTPGESKRLTNADQTLFALGQLDRTQDFVDEVANATRDLPLVDLLLQLREDVTAIKANFVPPFHGSEGGALSDADVERVAEATATKLAARLQA